MKGLFGIPVDSLLSHSTRVPLFRNPTKLRPALPKIFHQHRVNCLGLEFDERLGHSLPQRAIMGYLPSCTWGTYDYSEIKNNSVNTCFKNSKGNASSKVAQLAASRKEDKWFESLVKQNLKAFGVQYSPFKECLRQPIKWSSMPHGVDPTFGGLSGDRLVRKRQQVENMIAAIGYRVRLL